MYFVTLLCSALAALCTIAPAAYHRVLFRSDDKRHVVLVANRVVLVGLVFLALAMCGALLLVTTKLFGAADGAITAAPSRAFRGAVVRAPLLRRAEHEPATRLRRPATRRWQAAATAATARLRATSAADRGGCAGERK